MSIIRAAVGDHLMDFAENSSIEPVWKFVKEQIERTDAERPIVFMDDGGGTHGEIWDYSLFSAHWDTPDRMLTYLKYVGFDQDSDHQSSDAVSTIS
ncbi:hypothetical protein [Massilia sp. LjRoot122]|uniref:hypothetical protein n=1 Tax=Massilia sp. LjRoot122 TaxID=3342257 RepID=UPI003ECE35FB